MNFPDEWEFSSESESRLGKICLKLDPEKRPQISTDWLALFNYNSSYSDVSHNEIDVNADFNAKEEEIFSLIKEALQSDTVLSEETFVGISFNALSRIFIKVNEFLDELGFCTFCKFITSWDNDFLIENSMRLVVLPKLNEIPEASGLIIFSIKELAIKKSDSLCQNVLIPLLVEKTYTDVELLKGVFPVLPTPQKDLLILNCTKKSKFTENDWLLLQPLIKDLSQKSLFSLLGCIQKFSYHFTKNQIFGRFLVSFCKNLDFIGNKDILREVVERHHTLFKTRAMKYLDLL